MFRATSAFAIAMLAAVTFAAPAGAQSEFVGNGTNAFFVHAGGGTGSEINDLGAVVGGTLMGRYDLGVGLSRSTFDTADDMSAFEFTPFVSAMVVKQTKQLPFSFGVNAAYHNSSFSSDAMDEADVEMSATGFGFGAEAHSSFNVSPTMRLIPDAGVTYLSGDMTMTDAAGNEATESFDGTTFSFGSALAWALPSGSVFSTRVGMNVDDEGDSRFVGSLGMTFVLPGAGR